MKTRPSTIAWTVCIVAGLLVLGLSAVQKNAAVTDAGAVAVAGKLGGPFTLIDHNGKTVTEKSWPNKYLLIYFGFTHCPDVCPTGLNKIAEVLNALPAKDLEKIQPLLITIDPARDKVADLKNYVALFHPKLIGLTGTTAQIEQIESDFKVYAQKQGDGPDYMINHSAFTYLLDPYGAPLGLYSHDTTVNDMTKQISQALNLKSK